LPKGLTFYPLFSLRYPLNKTMKITSLSNPKIKHIVKLKQRKTRDETGLTIVDGLREVRRARDAGAVFQEVFMCPEILRSFSGPDLVAEIFGWGYTVIEVTAAVFEKIAFGQRREGIAAVVRTPGIGMTSEAGQKLSDQSVVVVLEQVEKPGNLGAILRSCDGAGVDLVIIADPRTDVFSPNVIRASTGMVFSLPLMQGSSPEVLDFLKRKKIKIAAATPQGSRNYFHADLTGPVALILGSEDQGLTSFWIDHADETLAIPMQGRADSLNVGITTALLVYEALRQRGNFEEGQR